MVGEMRSIAEQSGGELGGPISVLYRQRRDHIRLADYLEAVSRSTGTEQQRVLLSIYRLVFPHALAEEAVLWPVIRRVLPDGDALTFRVEREHQALNELVRLMERMPAGSAGRQAALKRTIELLAEDVRDEEDLLLPRAAGRSEPVAASAARCLVGGRPAHRSDEAASDRVAPAARQHPLRAAFVRS